MIMGIHNGLSMFFGMILAWAIFGPIFLSKGWTAGGVMNYQTGPMGWILLISLSILLSESVVSLLIIGFIYLRKIITKTKNPDILLHHDPVPKRFRIPTKWWIIGLILSLILCILGSTFLFKIPFWFPLVASLFGILVSVLAVRALGQTDINPSTQIARVTQLLFALMAPSNPVGNIIAGSISSAGALQAGDMMQDLKTGYLLGVSPKAQFYCQIIGSLFSVFFSFLAYSLFKLVYTIPGPELSVPTVEIWYEMTKIMEGSFLHNNLLFFCVGGAIFGSSLPLLGLFGPIKSWLPSGVAFAMAMLLTPNFTIIRVLGSVVQFLWSRISQTTHDRYMIIIASGFVIGEGVGAIITALVQIHYY